jgi:hypothetical protein
MFSSTKSSDFFFLYSTSKSIPTQTGFEEWALVNATHIPGVECAVFHIGFFAIAFATGHLRRRRARLRV